MTQTMKKAVRLITALVLITTVAPAQDYKTIWDHINKNNRAEALEVLQGKIKQKSHTVDEFITYMMLKSFDGSEGDIRDFQKQVSTSENPYAYIYSLWFTEPVAGGYGIKNAYQQSLMNYLINGKPGNGTLRASAQYSMGHHYIRSHQFPMGKKANSLIGALEDWQYVGPFNNISGSGFNKNYEPVKDPSNSTVFYSDDNAPIKWFTPPHKITEGWQFPGYVISGASSSIIFAQTFVNSPQAQDVYLCTGFFGNIKVWVNDQLLISVQEEKSTELDAYSIKCHLNAGINRILVQAGSEGNEPNFILRLTDSNFDPIKNITSEAAPKDYSKVTGETKESILPHFAETFFSEKIKKEPENLVNYILLTRTYLRSKKLFEARKTIEQAVKLAPDNSMLKYELAMCYKKENNRIALSEIYEYFKQHEGKSLIGMVLKLSDLEDQEKYQEALDTLELRISLYGANENTYEDKIQYLAKLNKIPQLLEVATEAFDKFPNEAKFANYAFNIEKNINKNPRKALKVLESFLAKHYNYDMTKLLIKEYYSQNNTKKPFQLLQELIDTWPFDPNLREDLMNEYFEQQRYPEAYEVCNEMLKQKPYSGSYFEDKATIEEAMGRNTEAIATYKTALLYRPTLYNSRDKMVKLEGKKNLFEVIPREKIEDLISNTGKGVKVQDHDYYYLINDQVTVIYQEGAREEEYTVAIKVLNQRGIDDFKEISLPYNEYTQTLVIEDAYLIKSNGKKSKPEISGNAIVWTGLETNDIIYVKYKKRYYLKGKFAQEYYDKFVFDAFVPIEVSRYTLIIPSSKNIHHQLVNGSIIPETREHESYKIYIWKKDSAQVIKDETYMPSSVDVATTLHLSTMKEWNEIAQWYSDMVYSKIANDKDYVVNETYLKLFDGKKNLTAVEKARAIYHYISENINYSSVSFRQSAIIPQKASKTINTRLGDCKDFSTLFVSLANMCGLKANLVLVSTRDNGKKDMILPSFLFNHCIVKYFDEKNTEYYLELTDRDLPFKSLPHNLYQAISLTVPSKDDLKSRFSLEPISSAKQTQDKVVTKSKVTFSGNDMNIEYETVYYGNMSSGFRTEYKSLNQEMTDKKIQQSVSKQFSNPVNISKVKFNALDKLLDSISVNVGIKVVNQVKKIGAQSAFTVPFTDVVLAAAPFNIEKRNYDFEYWSYEYATFYESQVEITLSAEKMLAEIPQSQKFTFNNIHYTIDYKKISPNKLLVIRKAKVDRNNITPGEYTRFKDFVSKIVDQEGSYITFK